MSTARSSQSRGNDAGCGRLPTRPVSVFDSFSPRPTTSFLTCTHLVWLLIPGDRTGEHGRGPRLTGGRNGSGYITPSGGRRLRRDSVALETAAKGFGPGWVTGSGMNYRLADCCIVCEAVHNKACPVVGMELHSRHCAPCSSGVKYYENGRTTTFWRDECEATRDCDSGRQQS